MSAAAGCYDWVIAGGGSAGCVLARRLSEDPSHRVLLLEAGPRDRNPFIRIPLGFPKLAGPCANWGYETVPQRHMDGRCLPFRQARVLGGGSSVNAQVYVRGNPRDYDDWVSRAGCAGWSFRELLPYFKRAEDNLRFRNAWHARGGPLGVCDLVRAHWLTRVFVDAAREAGLPYNPDFNGERQEGCGIYQVTQRNARRSSSVDYLHPARRRDNLTVLARVHATRIVLEAGRAVGVEYVDARGRRCFARARREVVLAAGAIGSPKLLMLSGIGPADELRALGIRSELDLPEVGRGLHDHVDVFVVHELAADFAYDGYRKLHRQFAAGLRYLLFRSGPAASNLAEGGGFAYADPDARSPDVQLHFLLRSGVDGLRHGGIALNAAFLRPRSRGSVRLASADPYAAPLIDPNYWSDPHDLSMSVAALRIARRIMDAEALAPYVHGECLPGPQVQTDDEVRAYLRRHAKMGFHPVGTCRMGADPASVVDPELRVRCVAGLRIADSSVMPALVSGNTNAPTMMIAEKAADLLLGRSALAPAPHALPQTAPAAALLASG